MPKLKHSIFGKSSIIIDCPHSWNARMKLGRSVAFWPCSSTIWQVVALKDVKFVTAMGVQASNATRTFREIWISFWAKSLSVLRAANNPIHLQMIPSGGKTAAAAALKIQNWLWSSFNDQDELNACWKPSEKLHLAAELLTYSWAFEGLTPARKFHFPCY